MDETTTHKRKLSTAEAGRMLKQHLNLPSHATVRFVVEAEYDEDDWEGRYGPHHVCRNVVITWEEKPST